MTSNLRVKQSRVSLKEQKPREVRVETDDNCSPQIMNIDILKEGTSRNKRSKQRKSSVVSPNRFRSSSKGNKSKSIKFTKR